MGVKGIINIVHVKNIVAAKQKKVGKFYGEVVKMTFLMKLTL